MATKEILKLGNPELWKISAMITSSNSHATMQIIRDLKDTLADFKKKSGFGQAIDGKSFAFRGEWKKFHMTRKALT